MMMQPTLSVCSHHSSNFPPTALSDWYHVTSNSLYQHWRLPCLLAISHRDLLYALAILVFHKPLFSGPPTSSVTGFGISDTM